jgi:hypothetical protein
LLKCSPIFPPVLAGHSAGDSASRESVSEGWLFGVGFHRTENSLMTVPAHSFSTSFSTVPLTHKLTPPPTTTAGSPIRYCVRRGGEQRPGPPQQLAARRLRCHRPTRQGAHLPCQSMGKGETKWEDEYRGGGKFAFAAQSLVACATLGAGCTLGEIDGLCERKCRRRTNDDTTLSHNGARSVGPRLERRPQRNSVELLPRLARHLLPHPHPGRGAGHDGGQ